MLPFTLVFFYFFDSIQIFLHKDPRFLRLSPGLVVILQLQNEGILFLIPFSTCSWLAWRDSADCWSWRLSEVSPGGEGPCGGSCSPPTPPPSQLSDGPQPVQGANLPGKPQHHRNSEPLSVGVDSKHQQRSSKRTVWILMKPGSCVSLMDHTLLCFEALWRGWGQMLNIYFSWGVQHHLLMRPCVSLWLTLATLWRESSSFLDPMSRLPVCRQPLLTSRCLGCWSFVVSLEMRSRGSCSLVPLCQGCFHSSRAFHFRYKC